jgi:hypothetical protein
MPRTTRPTRRRSARELGELEDRAELVGRLVALVDRTFTDTGHGEGLRMVREMLLRLDRPALHDLLRSLGIEGAEELSEPQPEGPSGRSR